MFYEEEELVIDGVLCFRTTPNREWIKYTPEQLTEMLIKARREIISLYEEAAGASL